MFTDENDYQDPYDALDWRWERALWLVNEQRNPEHMDDKYIRRSVTLLHDLKSHNLNSYEIARAHGPYARALSWHNHKGQKRKFLDAMLLCQDADEQAIAKYFDESVSFILVYANVFYDILQRKSEIGFLITKILEPATIQSLYDAKNPNFAWKMLALFGGFEVVKSCWEFAGNETKKVNDFLLKVGLQQHYRNFALSAFFRPATEASARDIADNILRVLDMEVRKAMISGMGDEMRGNAEMIQGILSSLTFTLAEKRIATTEERESRLTERIFDALRLEKPSS